MITWKSYKIYVRFLITKFNKPVRTTKSLHGCAGDYLNTIGVPIRNIHLAGGFVFAPSSWIKDAPYSDEFYFEGEEDLMTVQGINERIAKEIIQNKNVKNS